MSSAPHAFSVAPAGPFELAAQCARFGGWPSLPDEPAVPVIAFPLEGSESSAAVVLREAGDGTLRGEVHGCPPALAPAAAAQALAALSLDVDGSPWPAIGERDPAIGELQARYGLLRPVLFHSPYEAAAAFILGHRISIAQTRALRARLAAEAGETVTVGGHPFPTFPSPQRILAAPELPGVGAAKLERLRAVARAAQEGWLSRAHLRALAPDEALARLRALPGVGPFFAQGILYRGAGIADGVTDDDVTRFACARRYGIARDAGDAALLELAERWRPLRMWAIVLLHVWVRNEVGLPKRTFSRAGGTSGPRRARRPAR